MCSDVPRKTEYYQHKLKNKNVGQKDFTIFKNKDSNNINIIIQRESYNE